MKLLCTQSFSFHEHVSDSMSGAVGLHSHISKSGALFFHIMALAPASVCFYTLVISIELP